MKIKDIILEGRVENKTIKIWTDSIKLVLKEFNSIANTLGRDIAEEKLRKQIKKLDNIGVFVLLGDNDPITKEKYEEYLRQCKIAESKIINGL